MIYGLFFFLLRFVTWPLVLWQARTGKYSWWLTTPDDPFAKGAVVPHFGYYEESVRAVYTRFGRYWGDVYWLVVRNANFGLTYWAKPEWMKLLTSYTAIQNTIKVKVRGPLQLYTLQGHYRLIRLDCGFFGIIWGWRIDNIYKAEPGRVVQHPNMDGRPSFSIRSRKAF